MKLPDDYEIIVINDHDTKINEGMLRAFLPSLKVLSPGGFLSQERLFNEAAMVARGKFLLFIRSFINFDKLVLEESIKDLVSSGEKLSISASKNFVLAERFHYTHVGGFGGLFGSCDLATAGALEVTNGAIVARGEVEIEKLRSMREHRYKQEYLNWDLAIFNLPIRKTPHFQFIKDYQDDPKLKFESTSFWKLADSAFAIHRMKTNKTYILRNKGGAVNSAEQMCINFIKIYEKIRREGKFEPIEVTATHDGKYIITDGLHRASIACALGYEKVPVLVKSLDDELLKLTEILRNAYPRNGQNVLYTPINHMVFNNWKALRDDTRWTLIKDEFDWEDKRILDVGSYTGYFSHKIAKLGGNVTGIEIDDDRLAQSKMINILLELNVEFLHADFFEYLRDKKFDCILFFSVLHWILKNKGTNGVREALNILSSASPVMFLDMGQDNEAKMRLKEWNHGLTINKDTIPDLVISNSRYRYSKHLGTGDTGRDILKFTTFSEDHNRKHGDITRYIVKFDSRETEQFFRFEGKLATIPIVDFIDRNSNRCHGKLVDIGCGSKPYIKYFKYIDEYIGVDLISNEADIVANAKSLPIESNSVDVVLCNQVIEHDAEPVKIIAEIRRILKKDGVLILSAPQMGRLHGEPNDYYRFTKWGLNYLLEKNGMKIEVIEPHGGIFRAIGSHLNFFIIEYFGKNKQRRKFILRRTILGLNNFFFSFLDKLITWEKDTLGYNIIAKKRGH
jgi:SAM-dependent methyltransferase